MSVKMSMDVSWRAISVIRCPGQHKSHFWAWADKCVNLALSPNNVARFGLCSCELQILAFGLTSPSAGSRRTFWTVRTADTPSRASISARAKSSSCAGRPRILQQEVTTRRPSLLSLARCGLFSAATPPAVAAPRSRPYLPARQTPPRSWSWLQPASVKARHTPAVT